MKNANFDLMPSNKFGDRVRLARIEKGWSQRELARRIKKSATYIHYVESGRNPSAQNQKMRVGEDAVDLIAKTLGLDRDQARIDAGLAPIDNQPLYSIGFDAAVKFGADVSEEDRAEILSEIELAYRIIMERRKTRNEQ